MTGYGTFAPRVDRIARVRQFIAESGYGDAIRARIQGDASTRSYERFALGEKHVILMNSPLRPDGPPIRDGKPYSAIAHLAETVSPFVALANGLRERWLLRRPRSCMPTSRQGLFCSSRTSATSASLRAIRQHRS